MTITVAGKKKAYPDGLTVSQLNEAENVETPLYVNISLTDEFLDNDLRNSTILKEGDEVEFLYFMGGGC